MQYSNTWNLGIKRNFHQLPMQPDHLWKVAGAKNISQGARTGDKRAPTSNVPSQLPGTVASRLTGRPPVAFVASIL